MKTKINLTEEQAKEMYYNIIRNGRYVAKVGNTNYLKFK